MNKSIDKQILLLVDGHSLAFRNFYAFTKGGEGGLSTKDGKPTSVTYGFLKSLLDNCKNLSPQGITIAFDTPEPTFRHKADVNYKANREDAPEIFFEDLKQLQDILQEKLNLPICIAPGYEADDVLGTLANLASGKGWRVYILTGDRDLFQLVNDNKKISVLYMPGGSYSRNSGPVMIDEAGVKAKLGVVPDKVVDLKALTGDSSDNIPGVKGVGPKTAINLIQENNDLDGIYITLDQVEKEGEKASRGSIKGALKLKLRNDKTNAYLSKYLAKIEVSVPFKEDPIFKLGDFDSNSFHECLKDLELNSLAAQVPSFVAAFTSGGFNANNKQSSEVDLSNKSKLVDSKIFINDNTDESNSPNLNPKIILTENELDQLLYKLLTFENKLKPVAIDTETTDLNPFKAELVGIGFCWGEGTSDLAYIPIGHIDLGIDSSIVSKQLSLELVLKKISPWLGSEKHSKTLQNCKFDRLIFMRHGLVLKGVVLDTLLADYLRDSNVKHSLENMALREFRFKPTSYSDIVEKGKTFAEVDIIKAAHYCGMDVYLTRKLAIIIRNKLSDLHADLLSLLEEIEQPLESVLAQMEATGITIDVPYLNQLSLELKEGLKILEAKSYDLAGTHFNLASPKQLGEILFERLGLDRKKSRKNKTGWSTDANVLERLESEHPIVSYVIEHRVISKLLSTYVDALPNLVEKETGRVHTNFNQAVTSTGRLSSSNPNLQNIPIRTEFSRRIRKAFLPKENWKLLSADYSQIELRILAHLSKEKVLQDAYREGEDVHSLTAKILLEKDSVSDDERRLGKTINFGVIYGMGAQRFSRSTGLSQLEAKEFLRKYKERYTKVFDYLELQERLALSQGYVTTLMGRRRIFNFDRNGLGRLLGKDPYEIDLSLARRGGLEAQQLRAAANAPIQGSSADIIKLAMVNLQKELKELDLQANLLLQVHDELVIEVEPSSLEKVKKVVRQIMENSIQLSVPLLVELGIGSNWMETK